MIKFIALRLFLLNCKVNPKVCVKSIQKNEDLILRLISKTLSIRFQNSIDLFAWPVNKLRKKNQAFLRLHYPNSPIQREKKWNKYWRVTSKKERKFNYEFEPKFVHWNRRMKTHKFITKSHARLPFHHYTAFSAGMSLFWTTLFDPLRSNITFARSPIPRDHISVSLYLVPLEYALIQWSYLPFCSLVFSSLFFFIPIAALLVKVNVQIVSLLQAFYVEQLASKGIELEIENRTNNFR